MLSAADGDACLTKPYRAADLLRGLEIVAEHRRHRQGVAAVSSADFNCCARRRRAPRDLGWMESDAKVRKLLRQQAAIAGFGSFALRQSDLLKVLTEAARVCAEGLSVPFSKVCRYRADGERSSHRSRIRLESRRHRKCRLARRCRPRRKGAFVTGQPSICNDLRKDNDFKLPAFYAEHGIISTIDVVIKGSDQPYGVLEIDNDQQHDYDQHDIDFLTGFANVLAEAVATSARTSILQTTVEQMKVLVEEKDRLLDQKNILAEELQHRVRNNLQLVYGMLSKQADETADRSGRRPSRRSRAGFPRWRRCTTICSATR